MATDLAELSQKIQRLRTKSEKNKGRLDQIKEDKNRIITTLKTDFKVKSIAAAREIVESNYEKLRKDEAELQKVISRLDTAMENN